MNYFIPKNSLEEMDNFLEKNAICQFESEGIETHGEKNK